MSGCRNNCDDNKCGESIECKRPTSGLVYDGCDLPLWGARRGDSLNSVIEGLYRSFKMLYNNTEPVYIEHFKNTDNIHLSVKPTQVHMVFVCGGLVPYNMWQSSGQDIVFDSSICVSEGEVSVIFQGPTKNQFSTNCIL